MERLTTTNKNVNREMVCRNEDCGATEEHCPHLLEDECACLREVINKLADYEDAEEKGLLLRVPCKVGDTVYFLWRCSDLTTIVHPATVKSLSVGVYMLRKTIKYKIEPLGNCGMIKIFYSSDWGHRIFTTKEEADKALEVENALRTSTAERVLHELTMQAMFED